MRRERSKCSGCGIPAGVYERDPEAYMPWRSTCPWCDAMEQERGYAEADKKVSKAMKVYMVTRARGRQLLREMAAKDRPKPKPRGPAEGSTLA